MSVVEVAAGVMASFEAGQRFRSEHPAVSAQQAWEAFAKLEEHVNSVGMVSPRVDEVMRTVERFIQQQQRTGPKP